MFDLARTTFFKPRNTHHLFIKAFARETVTYSLRMSRISLARYAVCGCYCPYVRRVLQVASSCQGRRGRAGSGGGGVRRKEIGFLVRTPTLKRVCIGCPPIACSLIARPPWLVSARSFLRSSLDFVAYVFIKCWLLGVQSDFQFGSAQRS